MAATKFTCPQCNAVLKTAQEIQPGQLVNCPKCGRDFTYLGAAAAPTVTRAPVFVEDSGPVPSATVDFKPAAGAPAPVAAPAAVTHADPRGRPEAPRTAPPPDR